VRSRLLTGLWAHPDFVRLWAGNSISVFGSLIGGLALQFTAILWLDASAAEVAILAASQLIPGFLVSIAAGVWVDRLRRRPIMIAADLGRAAALFSIPIAAGFDSLTMVQLYAVGLVVSTLAVFFDSAYQSYLPALVEREDLIEGNAKMQGTASAVEVVSFSISGWLVQLLRAPGAVAVDAASFVCSAFFVWRIRTPEHARPSPEEQTGFATEAADGFRVVFRDGLLRPIALATAVQALASQVISVLFLLYLSGEVGFEPGVLGMIFAIGGVTSVAGAWMANRGILLFGGVGPTIVVSALFRAGGALFMPLCTDAGWLGVSFLVANQLVTDPFWTMFNIHDVSLRQAITPERVQGRMFANFRLLEFGSALAGTALAAALGATVGLRAGMFAACGLMFVSVAVLAASPVMRVRHAPPPQVLAEEVA
jgi:MFS family permease